MTDASSAPAGRLESGLLAPDSARSQWPEAIAIAAVAAAFGLISGPFGVLAGLATAIVWYAAGTPYAIAGGHVLLVALFPGGIGVVPFAVAEAAFVGLLVAPAVRLGGTTGARATARLIAVTLLAALSLAGVAWLAGRDRPLWVAGLVTLGALALASYGLHRYELVAFGLVVDEQATGADGDAPSRTETDDP
ncbi:hypothetical protein [Halosolutus gelatinilyticus]|uniref:hypothetical protein n=1 Tax=Halosolutus gelatinilyticus TaxID=2931975 RepID=UPI001FF1103C|nr:hypothetical protein [Halosolutus gelatinilyticus]